MVECPKCNKEVGPPIKTWTMKGRVQGKTKTESNPERYNKVLVGHYVCKDCGYRFRKGVPI